MKIVVYTGLFNLYVLVRILKRGDTFVDIVNNIITIIYHDNIIMMIMII